MKKCPSCGGGPVARDTRSTTFEYKGHSFSYDQPGLWCPDCGEVFLHKSDKEATDRLIYNFQAVVDGRLTTDDILRIRKKLGLTQKEAGEKIGGGPNAFCRYETGKAYPTQGAENFLRALDRNPELLGAEEEPSLSLPKAPPDSLARFHSWSSAQRRNSNENAEQLSALWAQCLSDGHFDPFVSALKKLLKTHVAMNSGSEELQGVRRRNSNRIFPAKDAPKLEGFASVIKTLGFRLRFEPDRDSEEPSLPAKSSGADRARGGLKS